MSKKYSGLVLIAAIAFSGCSIFKKSEESEYTLDLPDVTVNADKGNYKASRKRLNDLLHTQLAVSFDWENSHLLGQATLTFKPYFHPVNSLELDAQGFEIKSVALVLNDSLKEELNYKYDEAVLKIDLERTFTRDTTYTVFIDYIAKPDELASGGGAAIRSEKGLYFINPKGERPGKPTQIWTQGEPQASSRWFPTIDAPNEKTTQEIYITVDEKYVTLSNGDLIYSSYNQDGTRTDYWKQKLPHAPYLFMMAIGEFAVVNDSWEGLQVDYYVEPEYEAYAKDIFGATPEMMTYFSDQLGVKFPWQKYAQVVVRDYVSGAMENTSAVIHGDFLHKTKRELIDSDNEGIIAHELFHHWFGDLVTAESWSNLMINESFATYGEYLWENYKHGKEAGDWIIYKKLKEYLREAEYKQEPIVQYYYNDPIDLFDRHRYSKGGVVLHMLNDYLGDDAFFASLEYFLKENAYKSVEAEQLRLAFEEVTGEDLHWFFNQWLFTAGHPQLKISYDHEPNIVKVNINQVQKTPFKFPLAIDVYENDSTVTRHNVWVKNKEEVFTFNVKEKPKLVNVDAKKILLADKEDKKSDEEYIYQYYHAPLLVDRYESITHISNKKNPSEEGKSLLQAALSDSFYVMRILAIRNTDLTYENNDSLIAMLARTDPVSSVRSEAIDKLSQSDSSMQFMTLYENAIQDSSYWVNASALDAIYKLDPEKALAYANQYENETNTNIQYLLTTVYAQEGKSESLRYFKSLFAEVDNDRQLSRYISNYINYLKLANDSIYFSGIDDLKSIAKNAESLSLKNETTKSLSSLVKDLHYDKKSMKQELKKSKKDPEKLPKMEKRLETVDKKISKAEEIQEYINDLNKEDEEKEEENKSN